VIVRCIVAALQQDPTSDWSVGCHVIAPFHRIIPRRASQIGGGATTEPIDLGTTVEGLLSLTFEPLMHHF